MTVNELIEELRKYPGDMAVWMLVDDVRHYIDSVDETSLRPSIPNYQYKIIELVSER